MHRHDVSCFVHIFPLLRSMRWCADHACLCHQSAFFASLHDCLHFHAWVLLASVSSMLQHNEAMDTRSKPTFFPLRHPLLFTCLPFYSFAYFPAMLAMPIMLICFRPLSYTLSISFAIACLLVSCLCLCMYTHRAKAQSPSRKQKGWGSEHVDMGQTAKFSKYRSLAFPFWLCTLSNPFLPPPFLS